MTDRQLSDYAAFSMASPETRLASGFIWSYFSVGNDDSRSDEWALAQVEILLGPAILDLGSG